MVTKVQKTLQERGKDYGDFKTSAHIAQEFKDVVDDTLQYRDREENINPVHREAIDMILTKIARILSGNPNHADTWHDIAGYATLVEETLK